MTKSQKLSWAKRAVIAGAVPFLLYAYVDGPDAGKCGVPGESTCTEAGCHTGTVNSGPGSVTVTFPGGLNYTPGVKQHLVVTVADPNQRRWGFQVTARTAADAKAQAGSFAPTDRNTQLACASNNLAAQTIPASSCPASQPLQYIEHTNPGSRGNTTGQVTFEFDWTPPATGQGNIVIYVAGNAANNDANNTGDRIYTKTYTLTPSAGGGGPKPVISQNAVTNGASFAPGITGGSFFTVKGSNLANIGADGRTWRADEIVGGKLPTSLDNVSVTVNNKVAYIYFISPTQINAIAPVDSSQGPVSVVVTSNGQASDPATAAMQPFSPAFFMYNGTWAIATRNPDGALIGDPARVAGTVAAKPGDVIILWGTGFGPTNPAFPDGALPSAGAVLTTAPAVMIGGVAAPYIGGAISGFAGLYQVAVTVPDVSDGDQAIVAGVGGFSSPASVTIYVKK